MKANVIVINPKDNVAVALVDIKAGQAVLPKGAAGFPAREDIAYSHKVLLRDVADGQDVIKYGEIIGQAKGALKQGQWVHSHNLGIEED